MTVPKGTGSKRELPLRPTPAAEAAAEPEPEAPRPGVFDPANLIDRLQRLVSKKQKGQEPRS